MQQLAAQPSPGAILITSSAEGKEVAGRLAIKLDSGLITDAVDRIGPDTADKPAPAAGAGTNLV